MITEPLAAWHQAERPGCRLGHTVEAHASIGSTNDRARALLLLPDGEGVVVVAEEQTAGRGRRGRTWVSPPGANLTASVGVRPDVGAVDGWRLGMAAALALRAACTSGVGVEIGLKWPNDLVGSDGRKLAGLLVETAIEGDRLESAIIGFGINVNWRRADMPGAFADVATSLAELAGRPLDRPAVLRAALECLEAELGELEAGRSPLDRYRAACATIGSRVRVETGTGALEGEAAEIDEQGALVVVGPNGRVAVTGGEVVRVRPVTP